MFNLIQASKIVALMSFVIGTTLFSLFFYLNKSNTLLIIGLIYVIAAILINSILFFANLLMSAIYTENRINHIKTCGIILLNVPIAFLYLRIILFF
jgi:hypothetical protein